jgi:hypothetical protein
MSNTTVTLDVGREVTIAHLDQHLTYSGHREGVPTRELNRTLIGQIVEDFRALAPDIGFEVFPPVEQPFPDRPPVSLLPGVACGAILKGLGQWPDGDPCLERLLVVWFQDEYAMPIDPNVRARIAALDWASLATQSEW